jgi:hypothetical protein
MATLSQVLGTVVTGSLATTIAFTAFGFAVQWEKNSNLTPRAWSRPTAVIKNCLKPPLYGISWIAWSMKQSYVDLLAGIPGTGTRNNGWSGPTLKANVDAVIQIRFHMLQFKVQSVSVILSVTLFVCIFVLFCWELLLMRVH